MIAYLLARYDHIQSIISKIKLFDNWSILALVESKGSGLFLREIFLPFCIFLLETQQHINHPPRVSAQTAFGASYCTFPWCSTCSEQRHGKLLQR